MSLLAGQSWMKCTQGRLCNKVEASLHRSSVSDYYVTSQNPASDPSQFQDSVLQSI